jgi:hypothetical protein
MKGKNPKGADKAGTASTSLEKVGRRGHRAMKNVTRKWILSLDPAALVGGNSYRVLVQLDDTPADIEAFKGELARKDTAPDHWCPTDDSKGEVKDTGPVEASEEALNEIYVTVTPATDWPEGFWTLSLSQTKDSVVTTIVAKDEIRIGFCIEQGGRR